MAVVVGTVPVSVPLIGPAALDVRVLSVVACCCSLLLLFFVIFVVVAADDDFVVDVVIVVVALWLTPAT